MKRPIAILSVAALVAVSAVAAQAKQLRIENKRDVALEKLTIIAKSGATQQTFVLAENIEAGRVTTRSVPREHCLFDVEGVFADKSTLSAADMDLCSQHTIRLVK